MINKVAYMMFTFLTSITMLIWLIQQVKKGVLLKKVHIIWGLLAVGTIASCIYYFINAM